MSKKETIESRVKALAEREEKIKMQLDSNSDEMKEKAMRVGKIALIAGLVGLAGYWIWNAFFQEEEEEEEKPKKKKKKKHKYSSGSTSRITALLLPYLNRVLDGILEDEGMREKKNTEEKRDSEKED